MDIKWRNIPVSFLYIRVKTQAGHPLPSMATGMACLTYVCVGYFTTNTSISTKEPLGNSLTATAERAGKGLAKYSA